MSSCSFAFFKMLAILCDWDWTPAPLHWDCGVLTTGLFGSTPPRSQSVPQSSAAQRNQKGGKKVFDFVLLVCFKCVCYQSLSRVWLLWRHGRSPTKLLCPWDFPGKNPGVGWHFLLQIFVAQESNPHLLHWQADSLPPETFFYHLRHREALLWDIQMYNSPI